MQSIKQTSQLVCVCVYSNTHVRIDQQQQPAQLHAIFSGRNARSAKSRSVSGSVQLCECRWIGIRIHYGLLEYAGYVRGRYN